MMNRFVCHLSSLSGEQWYGSQRERGEGDTGGGEKQHPKYNHNRASTEKIWVCEPLTIPLNVKRQTFFFKTVFFKQSQWEQFFSAVMTGVHIWTKTTPGKSLSSGLLSVLLQWLRETEWTISVRAGMYIEAHLSTQASTEMYTHTHTPTHTHTHKTFEFIMAYEHIPLTTYIDNKQGPWRCELHCSPSSEHSIA